MQTSQYWISKLGLAKHPEGGYFKEKYRAEGKISAKSLAQFTGDRNYCTSIYFLLTSDEFSAFHKIKSDELWYFHAGTAIEIYRIDEQGHLSSIKLGSNLENEEHFQALVPANVWFASRVIAKESYALVSCTVSPGFDFEDFELAEKDTLISAFPKHKEIITELTR